VVQPPSVFGYASTIFGATGAIAKLKGVPVETVANALGIAASVSPVNSQIAWNKHAPAATIKYMMTGMLAQQAMMAACMAELGHRGDLVILDDAEYGYPRFIGTRRWNPGQISNGLSEEWLFPREVSYKIYAHCRVMHSTIDCLIDLVREQGIQPAEIDAMQVYVEGFADEAVWHNRRIEDVQDAQFSVAHGISMAAHQVPPGKHWQDPKYVFDPSVLSLMDRVKVSVHPDYVKLLSGDSSTRPGRVELQARGQTFVRERLYPKGTRSPDPRTALTDEDLVRKFKDSVAGVLPDAAADRLSAAVLDLEKLDDVGIVTSLGSLRS
jgi:2-methylcitrate dehydratase PrpD